MNIIGAGGHAKVIADIVLSANLKLDGFWDDRTSLAPILGYKILGNLTAFKAQQPIGYIIGIGDNRIRKKINAELNETTAIAVHPSSAIGMLTQIGPGTVVMANASINVGTLIGKHVIVNTNASVDHDCKIADFVHISPQAGLAGNVEVGEGTHIGIGAAVIQGVKIGKWVTVGAGAVVIRDIPDHAVVVGNPGKIIKYNKYE